MSIQSFLYRQKSRWQYHTANDHIQKKIAEINRYQLLIESRDRSYYIPEASIEIPKGKFDDVFSRFDLFIQNMRNLEGRYVWEEGKLYFIFDAFKVQILSSNELFIIKEIFFNQCYNLILPAQEQYNVIDIGMNVGLASLFFANQKNIHQIFSFEPFEQSFKQAENNFRANPMLSTRIKSFNVGLGKGERVEKLYFDPFASGTSGKALGQSARASHVLEQSVIIKDSYKTITSLLNTAGKYPYVLKVDCEGGEYEIMESLFDAGFPEEIIAILLEWHGSMPANFEQRILEAGFKMVSTRLKLNTGLIYAIR